jgi:hypothetical protein
MASYVEWDDIETPKKGGNRGSGGGGNSGKYLKFEANKTYTLRPVFKPVKFFKYYHKQDGQLRTAVTENADTCEVLQKHKADGLRRAQERRGFLAFHREDNNRLVVCELPPSGIEAFKHFKKLAKEEPGGPKGGDFKFNVVCPNGIKDRDTTYDVEFVEPKPFTEDERNFVKANKEEYSLEKIFGANSPEEIEQRLFGAQQQRQNDRPNNQGASQSQPAPQKAAAPVAVAAAPGGDDADDPFKW